MNYNGYRRGKSLCALPLFYYTNLTFFCVINITFTPLSHILCFLQEKPRYCGENYTKKIQFFAQKILTFSKNGVIIHLHKMNNTVHLNFLKFVVGHTA